MYTVAYAPHVGIAGYHPRYTIYQGDSWERAYEYARSQTAAIAQSWSQQEYECRPSLARFHTALRDGEGATVEVWSQQRAVHLDRPFTPALLGTVTVTRESHDDA